MTVQREILLPGGYLDESGVLHKGCVVREMTGKTQSLMGRKDLQKRPHELISQLMQNSLVSLGGNENPGKSDLDHLLSGDRDFILFEVRRLSLGNKYTHEFQCSNASCGLKLYEEVDLESDIQIWDIPEPNSKGSHVTTETVSLYGEDRLTRLWTVSDESGSLSATGRYITCKDARDCTDSKDNAIQTLHNLLSRMIIKCSIDGNIEEGPFNASWIDEQPYRVIEFLEGCMGTQQCGPDFTIEATCDQCGTTTTTNLEMGNFFVSSTTARGRESMLMRRSGSSAR